MKRLNQVQNCVLVISSVFEESKLISGRLQAVGRHQNVFSVVSNEKVDCNNRWIKIADSFSLAKALKASVMAPSFGFIKVERRFLEKRSLQLMSTLFSKTNG